MQISDDHGVGHIDIRALRFLALVLDLRNITRAGEVMGLSQPAASRLLAQLRRALGDDPLLVRTRAGYVPTARAARLMPQLADMLAATDRLFSGDRFDPATSTRRVRVATTDYGSAVVLTGLARDLAHSAPGISLEVRPWTTHTLDDLENGHVDIALYTDDPLPAGFHHQALFDERFACVVRHDHPVLAHRDQYGHVAATRLARLPRVRLSYIDGTRTEIDDPLAAFGDDTLAAFGGGTTGTFTTPYFLSGPLLLTGSDHVLCITRRIADLVAAMAGVVVLDLPEAGGFTYCMIWHDRTDADQCMTWLRRRIQAGSA